MEVREQVAVQEPQEDLAHALEALANPFRIALLQHLGTPAFMSDLVKEFRMTRQALKKHLDALQAVDLVISEPSRRGALPATRYLANPTGLFALKEVVRGLAVATDPDQLSPTTTLQGSLHHEKVPAESGLLLVHGDVPGRWFPLRSHDSWIVGRDPKSDVCLHYDPYASTRHALVRHRNGGWTLTDLHSTNGTRVNFQPVAAGETVELHPGDLVTIGKSHLILRDGPER